MSDKCNLDGLLVGFEYCLILSMGYVWFRVSSNTQYVLCLVSSIVGYSVCFIYFVKGSFDT